MRRNSFLYLSNFSLKKRFGIIGFCLFWATTSVAQLPTLSWRTHFNYLRAKGLVEAEGHIFCFTENGFFVFDKATKTSKLLTKEDGLHGTPIGSIAYHTGNSLLLIGYLDGTLDKIEIDKNADFQSIETIDFISKSTAIQGSKRINRIVFYEKKAFLATDFGLVEFDSERSEIKDTYRYIGNNGAEVQLTNVKLRNDSLFVKTERSGLVAAIKSGVNLSYFGNWKPFVANQVFSDSVYVFEGKYRVKEDAFFYDADDRLWLADAQAGFLGETDGTLVAYSPNGPADVSGNLLTDGNEVILLGSKINSFDGNEWRVIPEIPDGFKQDIFDEYGYRWTIYNSFVRVTDNTKNYYFSTQDGLSGNPKSLAFDASGYIWVGTDNGVSVIPTSASIFTQPTTPFRPIFGNQRLLLNQTVKSIALDGGNRKWFGTSNGLYLFNEATDQQIDYFTTENSPLPSNEIQKLAITKHGEVFVQTPYGLLSYQSDASSPADNFSDVRIFPNPVQPEFEGVLTIDGLREATTIKILDLAGNTVATLISNGGTASWDLRSSAQKRVATGVYIVLGIDADLTEKLVGKIAIISHE